MKKNTVTIKDVAKEAGVSVATVSYVINDNKEQSIKEETRQKIWQVVNMLNYKPNVFAKNLRMAQDIKLIAVCFERQDALFKAEDMLILETLNQVFKDEFNIIVNFDSGKAINNVEAIITYNLSDEKFHELGNLNYVPLIALDTLVNDDLFFQVTTDYESLNQEAKAYFNSDFTFVTLNPNDEKLKAEILKVFKDVIFINELKDLEKIPNQKLLTDNYILNNYFKTQNVNVYYNELKLSLKCEQVKACLNLALSRDKVLKHLYKI